jgi:hypothetical protein
MDCTNPPTIVATAGDVVASVAVTVLIVGITVDGAVIVRETLVVPMRLLLASNVSVVIVAVPAVDVGIWFSRDSGGVHVVDAPTPLPMVPEVAPKL